MVALAEDLVPELGDVNAGDVMRYSLTFTNLGPTTLQNVVAGDRGATFRARACRTAGTPCSEYASWAMPKHGGSPQEEA